MQITSYNTGHKGVEAHLASLTATMLEHDMAGTRLHKRPTIIKPAPAGCKYIALTQGKVTLVDEADYAWLMQWNWRYHWTGYAVRTESVGDASIKFRPRRMILMHRRIMGEPEELEVDHINSDRSDNRRCNLRLGTRSQNLQNASKQSQPTSSKYKGVSWSEAHGYWRSVIKINGKSQYIGQFHTEIAAAKAYNKKAKELFGDWAKINSIEVRESE